MLLIGDLLLWLLIAFHVVGGAVLFRRLFPVESPWLGFLVPPLAFVVVLNFLEHAFAIPSLLWLLPITVGFFAWLMFRAGGMWRDLLVPMTVFLIAFAFNFTLKLFHPDIPTDDSMADMNRMLDFCFGDKLPATDSWLPPLDHRWYYTLQHYGGSVIKRMFDVQIGTAYNLSFALINALICFAGAGIAYAIGGKRAWIAFLVMPVLEAGFTGSIPWLFLTMDHPDFGYAVDLDAGWKTHSPNVLFHLLTGYKHEALVLEGPGDWIWQNQYHANLSGFLLVFLAGLCALEILDARRGNWPWALLILIPPLCVLAAAWYTLLALIICGGTLVLAVVCRRRPPHLPTAVIIILVGLVLLGPALRDILSWRPHQEIGWTAAEDRTPIWTFLIQWWPIYLPWIALCFAWPRLSLGMRWLHGVIGLLYLLVEFFNVGDWRWDTIEKMWGAIYGLGLVALLPMLLQARHVAYRIVTLPLILTTIITLCARFDNVGRWIDWENGFLHLEGDSYVVRDPQLNRMLAVVAKLHKSTLLAGICRWNYSPPVALADFTENRCYVAWFSSEEICGHADEAHRRRDLNNQFYDGTMADPLAFLRDNRIDAAMIHPEDTISDAVLDKLKQALKPEYDYIDCKGDGANNAGIFLRRQLFAARN